VDAKQLTPDLPEKTLQRFWDKVEQNGPDECWPWTAALNDRGYGKFWTGKRLVYAHRLMYVLAHGSLSAALTIDHLCRVRNCVNPAHLEAVTLRENILRSDSTSARHARKTHCPKGHPYDDANTRYWHRQRHCRTCHRENRRKGGDA
jgi:hypothetical protein